MSRRSPLLCLLPLALAVGLVACERSAPPEPPAPPADPEPVEQPASTQAPVAADPFAAALAGEHRSDEHRARDAWRNPAQTLEFFGLTPASTVVEVTPGGGWYTEVLAPVLRGQGRLVAAIVDPASASNDRAREYYERANGQYREKLAGNASVYDGVEIVEFDLTSPRFGEDESADLVVTFRNVHNWTGSGAAPGMFEGFYKVLKPGGTLGLVEHRAQPGSAAAENPGSGYMTEDSVIALATAAGFELAERSEINANPADTTDHPNGVWTLPPSLRVPDDQDPETYRAIGESDRMTLRFTKPRGDVILRQGMDDPSGAPAR